MTGLAVGLLRFGLEFGYSEPPCGSSDPKPPEWLYSAIKSVHYLHFGFILWIITGVVTILVSLVTEPIPSKYLHRLTFWTRHSTEDRLELDKLGEEHEEEYKVQTYLKNIMENMYLIAFLPAFQ